MRPQILAVMGLAALAGACAASPQRQQSNDLTELIQLRAETTAALLGGRMQKVEGQTMANELDWAQNDISVGEYGKAEALMAAEKTYLDALK